MANKSDRNLYRFIYYSQNSIPGTESEVATEIEAILAASQRNNMRDGITGALIFNSGIFAQVLEGDRPAIEATFERIQRDPRHGSVQVLAFEPAPVRSFPTWSMAFIGRSRTGQHLFEHISNDTGFETKRLEGERILEILQAIAMDEEQSRAA